MAIFVNLFNSGRYVTKHINFPPMPCAAVDRAANLAARVGAGLPLPSRRRSQLPPRWTRLYGPVFLFCTIGSGHCVLPASHFWVGTTNNNCVVASCCVRSFTFFSSSLGPPPTLSHTPPFYCAAMLGIRRNPNTTRVREDHMKLSACYFKFFFFFSVGRGV